MNEDDFEMNPIEEERISLEASEWSAKRDDGFKAEDQDAFFEWLATDPRHKAVYPERLAFWGEMDDLSDWRPEHSLEPNPDLLASRTPRPWRARLWALGGMAAAFVLGLFFVAQKSGDGSNDSRILAFGGAASYENYVLEDGSIVELNQGAEVSVQFTEERRLVFLHSGEAHFMVETDLDRPFQVRAGRAIVQATGTAFNVALEESGIEVLVTEGRVLLEDVASLPEVESIDLLNSSVTALELAAGQQMVMSESVEPNHEQVVSVSEDEIEQRLGWKGEVLDFTNAPLKEVVEAFNRRNRVKVSIASSALVDEPVTATLRSNNLDGFIELLEVAMEIEAVREGPWAISLSR